MAVVSEPGYVLKFTDTELREIVETGHPGIVMINVGEDKLTWILAAVEDGKLSALEAKHLLKEAAVR